MRKLLAVLMSVVLLLSLPAFAAAAQEDGIGSSASLAKENSDEGEISIGGLDSYTWMTKYGNVHTDCKAEDFLGSMGFQWGDMVTVEFLDKSVTLPVVPEYSYVGSGNAAVVAKRDDRGDPIGYVTLAMNMGDFATTYGLAEKHIEEDNTWYWTACEGVSYPVALHVTVAEKGGFLAEYLLHDLNRTNNREDYRDRTDAEFANFRNVATTGMKKNVFYRGSSPINPELGRNGYADAALKAAGVSVIMNLANSREDAQGYEGFEKTYYSGQKVIYLNLGADFFAPEFQKSLADGLRFFAENEGVYYVHCTEGKDRGGFVSALLECLMGATYDEVVEDYMITYRNYYGVEKGSEKYDSIAKSNIVKTLQKAFGVDDLSKADLQKGAKDYCRAIGLTDSEIGMLMNHMGHTAPQTGDASMAIFAGLAMMAFVGGACIVRRKRRLW